MDSVTLDQAIDITQGTLEYVQKKQPAMTFLYSAYDLFNTFWKDRMKVTGGDKLEWFVSLGDEGNAQHTGFWNEDTRNKVNITKKCSVDWVRCTGNMSYNTIEIDMNKGPARIFDVLENQYTNAIREMVDEVYEKIIATPSSSTDDTSPHGLPTWFTIGSNGSTGGWTGYSGHYNDGDSPGATYSAGGLASSSTSNARHASYWADHDGDLDDSLLVLLDRATRKLHFSGPTYPRKLDTDSNNFSFYSNDNVIGTLNLLYAKSDDQMGARIDRHFGRPSFKGISFVYVDPFDTANTSTYGTDPIFGINHNLTYPCVLNNWDFKIGKPQPRDSQHVVLTIHADLVYAIRCDNRRRGGFLIAQR